MCMTLFSSESHVIKRRFDPPQYDDIQSRKFQFVVDSKTILDELVEVVDGTWDINEDNHVLCLQKILLTSRKFPQIINPAIYNRYWDANHSTHTWKMGCSF